MTDHQLLPSKPTPIPDTDRQAMDILCTCGWNGHTSQAYVGEDLHRKARLNHKQHVRRAQL